MYKIIILILIMFTITNSKELVIDGLLNVEQKQDISFFNVKDLTQINDVIKVELINRRNGKSQSLFYYFNIHSKNLKIYLDSLDNIQSQKYTLKILSSNGDLYISSNNVKFRILNLESKIPDNQIDKNNVNLEKRIITLEELHREFNLNSNNVYDLSNYRKIENLEELQINTIYKLTKKGTNETILYIAY